MVRKRADLLETIIPFFRTHQLRSAKGMDFEKFAHCMKFVDEGRHLRAGGLIEIVEM